MTISLAAYSGTIATSSTEISLITGVAKAASGLSSVGLYSLWLDVSAMVSGDQMILLCYESVTTTSAQYRFLRREFAGIALDPAWVLLPMTLGNNWDMTLTMISATGRSIPYSIRSVT